jgi:hypothetical protein
MVNFNTEGTVQEMKKMIIERKNTRDRKEQVVNFRKSNIC